ncbi:hypothetical protein ACUODF_38975, partial [Escherichia coli]
CANLKIYQCGATSRIVSYNKHNERNKAMGCIVLLLLGFRLWISPVFPATSSTLRKPLLSSGITVSPCVARPDVNLDGCYQQL